MRDVRRRSAALVTVLVLSLGLASGVSFGEACGPSASCPMVAAGSKSHCQPGRAITADCCAKMSPVASQTIPARVVVEPSAQTEIWSLDDSSPGVIEPIVDQPEPVASKLHDIGRHTLFQVFLS